MNIREKIDYSEMSATLDVAIAADLPQMALYQEIGCVISSRVEKGATLAVAEYLKATYPDVAGFSARNLWRMREFYSSYASEPEILCRAAEIGWTQNVVIFEPELTVQERHWYIQAVQQFDWFNSELKI